MEVYKDLKNGFYLCNICTTQVKAKVWTAHSNGRKHRENVQLLKEKLLRKTDQTLKRAHSPEHNENSKKSRDDDYDKDAPLVVKTPWQEEVDESSRITAQNADPNNIIESLPEGFFDNQELNSRVRETLDRQKHLDDEVNKFFNEIAEDDRKQVEDDDMEAESSAVQKDLELIDEQIERWRAINELEKRREELTRQTPSAASTDNPNFERLVVGGLDAGRSNDSAGEDDNDDKEDFDVHLINWRAKLL